MNREIEHIAVIMDGNGRWATKQNLPRTAGHIEGTNRVSDILKWAKKYHIKYLTLYAFSSENWKRPQEEVDALMELFREFLVIKEQELMDNNISFNVSGRIDELSEDLQILIAKLIETTKNNDGLNLIVAINYGGRLEIVDTTKKIAKLIQNNEINIDDINETLFAQNLYNPTVPDPELLIRTSGELRISNFLLWELSYSEFYITDKLWPDFDEATLVAAIDAYKNRDRRQGGLSNDS